MFPAAPTYTVYAAVIAGDWAWSVVSTCLMRRIKDIPKPQLARDVACIVLCYAFPMVAAAAAEVSKQVEHDWKRDSRRQSDSCTKGSRRRHRLVS